MTNYQFCILRASAKNWKDPAVQDMFTKMISLKLAGYRNEYPYGVLPVDTTDMVASHILIVDKETNQPVAGYKSVELRQCEFHKLEFPIVSLAKVSGNPDIIALVDQEIARCKQEQKNLAYQGGWTMDARVRASKSESEYLRNMVTAGVYFFNRTSGVDEVLGAGATRFKADKFFKAWGCTMFQKDGIELPAFKVPSFFNEEVRGVHLVNWSDWATNNAKQFESAWANRVELGNPEGVAEDSKRAA